MKEDFMQLLHINHDKTRLLIFFGGFYTDYNCFKNFDTETSDILFINDYSDMDFEELRYFDFTPYTEINLIAYSYGVWALNCAYITKALPKINKSIAISGTFCPVHTLYGINPKVFNIMLNAMSISSLGAKTIENFEQNMLANCNSKSDHNFQKATRTLENLRQELISIKNNAKECKMENGFQFDTVILTKEDKIFPFRAQDAFFEHHPHRVILNTGHFPFFEFENLDKILEL